MSPPRSTTHGDEFGTHAPELSHARVTRCESDVFFPKTSIRFAPHDTCAGAPVCAPPRFSQLDQPDPVNAIVSVAPSLLRTNTSRRFVPQLTARGSPTKL